MARRLIGLDIGTNAVTIAEVTAGTPPRLDMFAQVALPRDAMREGEVADEAAITDAVARLRAEVGLKKVPVRVGIASPRVVVRQVEMPVMTRDELMSALQFQAGDLIPIPIEDAVLDFAILGTTTPAPDSGAEPTMQVLLVAAYEATVVRLVSAIEAGGLEVGAVDLIPLALTRALARPVGALVSATGGPLEADEAPGAEGIVSFGGGVTAIAVHEAGVPQFVRVLGSGGRELTDAIATDLGVPAETAEALKRALANPTPDEMVARARTVGRPSAVGSARRGAQLDRLLPQPAGFGAAAARRRHRWFGAAARSPGAPVRARRCSRRARVHARPVAHRRHRVRTRRAAAARAVPSRPGRPRARRCGCRHGHRPAAQAPQLGIEDARPHRPAGDHRRRCRGGAAPRRHVQGAQRPEQRPRQGRRRAGRRQEAALAALLLAAGSGAYGYRVERRTEESRSRRYSDKTCRGLRSSATSV